MWGVAAELIGGLGEIFGHLTLQVIVKWGVFGFSSFNELLTVACEKSAFCGTTVLLILLLQQLNGQNCVLCTEKRVSCIGNGALLLCKGASCAERRASCIGKSVLCGGRVLFYYVNVLHALRNVHYALGRVLFFHVRVLHALGNVLHVRRRVLYYYVNVLHALGKVL
jgi:hypothetical protein